MQRLSRAVTLAAHAAAPPRAVARYSVLSKALNLGKKDPLSEKISEVQRLVEPQAPLDDPFSIVSHEMTNLGKNIASLIGSNHPTLNKVSAYYFQAQGKHIRPLVVLLLSKALAAIPQEQRVKSVDTQDVYSNPSANGVNDPLSPLNILHGINADLVLNPLSKAQDNLPSTVYGILPKQRRLAEIVEMIHTASLLHDDVIDNSDTRRSMPSGNVAFSNKMAILAGDFLLARASVAIARLRHPEVIELLSTTIANLVEGEFMQLKNTANSNGGDAHYVSFQYYIHKTYLKTASLMSKSCRGAAVLASCNQEVVDATYQFGRSLGLCFQIVDDMLDYTTAGQTLGKPSGADLQLGLATAPVLFAWEKYPELGDMIKRKFSEPGDVERARELVTEADGVEQTRKLAQQYHDDAIRYLEILPDSEALEALRSLTHTVLSRQK